MALCAEWGGPEPEVATPRGAASALAVLRCEIPVEVGRSHFPDVWASVSLCVR